jgi:hypothetical protein
VQLIHLRGEEALAALRAMMAAAAHLLMAIDSEVDIDGLEPITPEELAAAITTPGRGEQLDDGRSPEGNHSGQKTWWGDGSM